MPFIDIFFHPNTENAGNPKAIGAVAPQILTSKNV